MIPQQHRQNIELVYSDEGRNFFSLANQKLEVEDIRKLKTIFASKGPEKASIKLNEFLEKQVKIKRN